MIKGKSFFCLFNACVFLLWSLQRGLTVTKSSIVWRVIINSHVPYSDYCEQSSSEADQLMGAMDKGEM